MDDEVHSVDEFLCRPFSGDVVDFGESLFQALISIAPSGEDKVVADFSVVLDKCSPPGAQEKDIGIWRGDSGIGIHVWIHDQETRRLVLKHSRHAPHTAGTKQRHA